MSEPYDNMEYGVVSDCCGATVIWTDVCGRCKEHCGVVCDECFEEDCIC